MPLCVGFFFQVCERTTHTGVQSSVHILLANNSEVLFKKLIIRFLFLAGKPPNMATLVACHIGQLRMHVRATRWRHYPPSPFLIG